MDFLQTLGDSLRIAAGGLSEKVYTEQNKQDLERMKLKREQGDAYIKYIADEVSNGRLLPEEGISRLKARGYPTDMVPTEASAEARKAMEATKEKQQTVLNQSNLGDLNTFLMQETPSQADMTRLDPVELAKWKEAGGSPEKQMQQGMQAGINVWGDTAQRNKEYDRIAAGNKTLTPYEAGELRSKFTGVDKYMQTGNTADLIPLPAKAEPEKITTLIENVRERSRLLKIAADQTKSKGERADAERQAISINQNLQSERDSKRLGAAEDARNAALWDKDTLRFNAIRFESGDKSVMQALGGYGGAAAINRANFQKEVRLYSEEQGYSPQKVASLQAEFTGVRGALNAVIKLNAGQEKSMLKIAEDIKTLESTRMEGNKDFAKVINQPLNWARTQSSDPKLRAYALAVKQVAIEYMRQLSGGQLSITQLHQGAQEDAKNILNENMSIAETEAIIKTMIQEMKNGINSGRQEEAILKGRLEGKVPPSAESLIGGTPPPPSAGGATTHTSLPDAKLYDGKIATDTETNTKYKSIHGQWVKQ